MSQKEVERRIEDAKRHRKVRLDLSNLSIDTLPKSVWSLSQLQELHLSLNQFKTVPQSIGALKQLQVLVLGNNQINYLPESIGALTQLRTLDLRFNKLSTLPEPIKALTNLQELILWNNQLSTLPEAISALTQLQVLDLSHNQLSSLPEAIMALAQLQKLVLRFNQLSILPDYVGALTQLKTLDLGHNQLDTLPESIAALTQLQKLVIGHNELSSLPECIGFLTQLKTLDLGQNEISSLPESIAALTLLQELVLRSNHLDSLPESIGTLSQLRKLDLIGNRLSSLPESIGALTQLRRVDLSDNHLSTLPESITALTELQVMNLKDNDLYYPPNEIARMGFESIRAYILDHPKPAYLYAFEQTEAKETGALYKLLESNFLKSDMRGQIFQQSEISLTDLKQHNLTRQQRQDILPMIFRYHEPDDETIKHLVQDGDFILPTFDEENQTIVRFPYNQNIKRNESNKNAIPLTELSRTSTLLTELFLHINLANKSCGIILLDPPIVTIEKGSIKYTISGGPFAVGIAILIATAKDTLTSPLTSTAAGVMLLSYGIAQMVKDWKQQSVRTKKYMLESEISELDKELKQISQEKKSKSILPASNRIQRSVIQKISAHNNVSEVYANHIINRLGDFIASRVN